MLRMNPNKALWEKGDFTRIAETMRESGEALVQRLGITKGLKVLDLGCGDGTTALPAAKLGAEVLGVDVARNLGALRTEALLFVPAMAIGMLLAQRFFGADR